MSPKLARNWKEVSKEMTGVMQLTKLSATAVNAVPMPSSNVPLSENLISPASRSTKQPMTSPAFHCLPHEVSLLAWRDTLSKPLKPQLCASSPTPRPAAASPEYS